MPEEPRLGSLPADIPAALPEELFTELVRGRDVRVERIVSRGHVSPKDFWYDQEEDEFVVLLSGRADVEIEGHGVRCLGPLDWVDIPAHVRHRVTFTDPASETIWLAVFYRR